MFGYVEWSEERQGRRGVSAGERMLGGVRFYAVTMDHRGRSAAIRRRCHAGMKLLKKAGVGRTVLPADFPCMEALAKYGVRPVSDMALRREMAAQLTSFAMAERGVQSGGATVAVMTDRLSPEVIRTVTALSRRSRYILLEAPYGGEAFCRELRRTQGVSVLLAPTDEQLEGADVLLQFARREGLIPHNRVHLPLYAGAEDAFCWSALLPGDGREEGNTALLAALWEAGALRTEELQVAGVRLYS